MIKPYGGKLVNQVLSKQKAEKIISNKDNYYPLSIGSDLIKDVKNIARGVYSPLTGFLKEKDFQSVLDKMRLTDGTVWPIPIVLDINKSQYKKIKNNSDILLVDQVGKPIALLKDIEIYKPDKKELAKSVYQTQSKNHPGVKELDKIGDYFVGGEVKLLDNSQDFYPEFNCSPKQTRKIFNQKGWETIVGFQTRNAPHRGHEFLQKAALGHTDGLFIQPVIGRKKLEDFKDEYILASYEVLIDRYYNRNRVVLGILPLKMRYAGPKEAVFHAIIRQNFGCSHFIVGRDHAGVGDFYGHFDAQKIFNHFSKDDLQIEILKYKEVLYCPKCSHHVFINECPHENRVMFSGSQVRKMIKTRKQAPKYLIRPEVYYFLSQSGNSLVDKMYNKNNNHQKGFVLWFTGLSQSGKTTTADAVFNKLKEKELKVERLDGDIVRQHLSKDLGFTKEDRDENIRRIGFVSRLLSKNGIGVVASFISPYQAVRDEVRQQTTNFIEVFCSCPLEICEQRDSNGLYEKARKGEIDNFTGISHPYEQPENPDIELDTADTPTQKLVEKILTHLEEKDLI